VTALKAPGRGFTPNRAHMLHDDLGADASKKAATHRRLFDGAARDA